MACLLQTKLQTRNAGNRFTVNFLIDNIWLVLIALVSGGALAWPALSRSKLSLSTLQATQLLNKGKAQILDVRTADEFAAGHLRNARHIPVDELDARVGELDKARPVLVVCQTGPRAQRAAGKLARAGFAEVFILDGGYAEWQSQGLPTAK